MAVLISMATLHGEGKIVPPPILLRSCWADERCRADSLQALGSFFIIALSESFYIPHSRGTMSKPGFYLPVFFSYSKQAYSEI